GAPGSLTETEPDQKAHAADGKPGRPREPARRREHLGRQQKDAGPDDAVDPQPDTDEQGHAARVLCGHLLPAEERRVPALLPSQQLLVVVLHHRFELAVVEEDAVALLAA